MAQRQYAPQSTLLYERYVQALKRYGDPGDEAPSPGHVIRYCHNCGMRAMFRLDPEGNWYECLHCKHYA
jgi:hypothetical protein